MLQAIVNEFDSFLPGQRLGKVSQLGVTDLALDFRLRDGRWLMIATDPQRLALYLTNRSPKQLSAQRHEEARTDTPFVALLKKYLSNARLLRVEKLGYDRVVHFDFEAEDEDERVTRRTLIVWLTGRTANVWLLEQSRVLAVLREREETITAYADPPPPADKLDPFLCSAETLSEWATNADFTVAAQKHLLGFTPLYAAELAARAVHSMPHEAADVLSNLLQDLFDAPLAPTLYSSPSLTQLQREIGCDEYQLILSPIVLRHLANHAQTHFDSINQAADECFTLLDVRRSFVARKQKRLSQLSTKLKKHRSLAANLQRERAGFIHTETYQRSGELLLANLHQARKIDAGFAVTDFYDETQPVTIIPSANKATPKDAAEHYFKLARKARHGLETINRRLPEIEKEIAELETQIARLALITRAEELNALAEFPDSGAPKQTRQPQSQTPKKSKEEKISGVRRYRSTDGYEILVGRTDRDNDHLTLRVAKSLDLWFHAADYPGSHVVLRNPKRQPVPSAAITEAAQLAAKFSQARENAKVAVNFCEKKFVTKPKGFAPGQVRLSSFKTIIVEPKEAGERVF